MSAISDSRSLQWCGLAPLATLALSVASLMPTPAIGQDDAVPAADVSGPNDYNPTYVGRKSIAQVQVVAAELRLYAEPDVTSLVVGKSDRGQLLTVVGQQGDWFKVRIKNEPEAFAWVLR